MQEVELDHEMATLMREMVPVAVRWYLGEIEEEDDDDDEDFNGDEDEYGE